jgi:hypothetical protein
MLRHDRRLPLFGQSCIVERQVAGVREWRMPPSTNPVPSKTLHGAITKANDLRGVLFWLNRFRRLKIPYERRADIQEAFLTFGCALMCWNYLDVAFSRRETATSNLRAASLSSLSSWAHPAGLRKRAAVRLATKQTG